MFKDDFINAVSEITGMTKKDTKDTIDAYNAVVVESMKNDDEILLKGFGKFKPVIKAESVHRNPRTGEEVISPAHRAMKFYPSEVVKREIYDI